MRNSYDNIGNRTRDLPACSAVPQTTEPQRATEKALVSINLLGTRFQVAYDSVSMCY